MATFVCLHSTHKGEIMWEVHTELVEGMPVSCYRLVSIKVKGQAMCIEYDTSCNPITGCIARWVIILYIIPGRVTSSDHDVHRYMQGEGRTKYKLFLQSSVHIYDKFPDK